MYIFKYCPCCAQKLIIKKIHQKSRLFCPSCHFIFYQNSKPSTAAVITQNKKILLARRAIPPKKGWWDTPGGFLENGELPEDGIKREIKEELGVAIKPIKLLGIYIDTYQASSHPPYKTLNFCYLSKIIKGKIKPADDVKEVKWFNKNNLPKKIAFKNAKMAIRDWKKLK
jgi:ADP-ribose pyrophosphatase YjhB (NUDIX family)